ncbi:MAG: hypothetical protein JO115_16320 [Pseudonocardiales bacterium]|nr:hypothetical protein [Pseudonocardiales bacterium]
MTEGSSSGSSRVSTKSVNTASQLFEFDASTDVLLDPVAIMAKAQYLNGHDRVPDGVVLCFFRDVVTEMAARAGSSEVVELIDARRLYAQCH